MKKEQVSLVKGNKNIRAALISRMEYLSITPTSIIKDAKSRGVTLDKSQLSKYLNNKKSSTISEENLIWLCIRYGILLRVDVKVVEPYNEEHNMELLKKVFPGKYDIRNVHS